MSEKKKPTGLETPEYRLPTPPPAPKPAAACEHITIPVAEYMYLQRVDALMDVLLHTDDYSPSSNMAYVVGCIKETVNEMRNPGKGGADQ